MAETVVYLLRHAQTIPEDGVPNKDWQLSDSGKEQAQNLVKVLQDLDIDLVYSSPYIRALQTLDPFLKKVGKPATTNGAFVEIQTASNYMNPVEFQELSRKMIDDMNFAPEGEESIKDCQIRFMKGVNKVAKKNWGKKILICSHGMPILSALKTFDEKLSYDDFCRIRMPEAFKLDSDLVNGGRWDRKFSLDLKG